MEKSEDLLKILDSKEIEVFGKLKFSSKEEKISFLARFEKFEKKGISIKFLNQDLVDILLEVKTHEGTIQSLKKINWKDFHKIFKEHKSKLEEKIYNNFISFLRNELHISKKEENKIKTKTQKLETTKTSSILNHHDNNIFEIDNSFNIKEDLKIKLKKYKIDLIFDYNEPSHKLTVTDFTLYFNRRLQYFTNLLSNRVSAENVVRINQLRDLYNTNTQVTIIGLISEITETKKGHYMITIEDKSGEIKCFVNKDKTEMMNLVHNFCLDEGIGVKGKVGENIIWTDEFLIPSPPNEHELKKTKEENFVVMISDIHFGAKVFQDEAFQKFLEWINGNTQNDKLNQIAKKVTHVLIPGDIIEGIGIYPGQGEDARILSTEGQYHEAARWLAQIPKHIGIIIIPGNHDTDRLSEPQPKLPYHKSYALYNMENVIIVSNPAIVKLFSEDLSGGLEFYMYHGGSFFYYADKIQHLREKGGAKVPEEVVKFLLEKRHLAPSHGATLYFPDTKEDPLVIKKMPDFFLTGHTHKMALANYKGCTIVSCGCWVEMSDYQEKMGMYPDVGKAIVINTKTRKPHILDFYTEKHKKQNKNKE